MRVEQLMTKLRESSAEEPGVTESEVTSTLAAICESTGQPLAA